MKKHAKLLVVLLALVMVLSVVVLTACNKQKTKNAYGLVHGKGYVCQATVVVAGNSLVSADLVEACLPTYVTAQTPIQGYTVEGTYNSHGSARTANFYKTIKFADVTMVYDGTLVDGYSKGYMVGTQTMLQFFENEANCEKYFKAVSENKVSVVLANGEKTDILNAKALLKTQNGYWGTPAQNALGWTANVKATCDYVVAHGFDGASSATDFTQEDHSSTNPKLDNEFVDKNGVSTGATWTDMWDYFSLLKKAYQK
ncbi:MAG TPA: hypothetical protein IAC95_02410 [Candidatus Fimimonas gallinarum]|uniref:Uncharacterized protein n=1 Tax=Candidatus Fimimonas gallinarum TaxID=2840821 RepID=A0A9D1E3C2_9BACT|nr:hypothetical protein [Candidatus Fimimonas gallinarum]